MTDKWTMGSNNEGLYNGINPSCRKKGKKEKGKDQETTTVAPKEQPKGIHIIQKLKC